MSTTTEEPEVVDAVPVEEGDGEKKEDEPVTSQELVLPEAASRTLFKTDDPVEVLEKAGLVANALKGALVKQGMTTKISNRDHVNVEGWQTVGSQLGVFAVKEHVEAIPWPEHLTDEALLKLKGEGKDFGFIASYKAVTIDGHVVGAAEGECRRTEKTWRFRDDQNIRSMAQTRATSKALKAPLGFVVTLAGYSATPAEEMPQDEAPPFGAAATEAQEKSLAKSIEYLIGQSDGVGEVVSFIGEKAQGYIPKIAVFAIGAAAKKAKEINDQADKAAKEAAEKAAKQEKE